MITEFFSNGKELLAKEGLLKVLHDNKSKSYGMTDEYSEDMDIKEVGTIELCLTDEVVYNVMDETSAVGLWLKLESLCNEELV